MSNDDLHQLAGPYALGALDADEDERFQAHLAECTACQDEVREFAAVRDQLGQGVAEPAPAHLREQVLARAAATPQLPPQLDARRRSTRRRTAVVRGVLAAAAAVVLVVGGLAYANVRSDREAADDLLAILSAPDADTVPLTGEDDARLRVVWSPALGEGVLLAGDLAPPGSDHDYQLWMLEGEEAVPGITFEPDDGRVQERFDVTAPNFDAMAVTIEPDGGSDQPTLPTRYASAT
jgi:anti-sigma-K factor RskA